MLDVYAPTGRLRAALNFGNPVLARRGGGGSPAGITADLAAELAHSLGGALELVSYDRAFDVTTAAMLDEWDVCFLAVDPERSRTIAFTQPYLRICGCYLAAAAAGVQSSDDVAESEIRIGVVEGSAYALFLSRRPGAENLVFFPSITLALAAMDDGGVDAIAGIEQVLEEEHKLHPGTRILRPPFMEIRQAMGIPKARAHILPDLEERLSDLRTSGTLSRIVERHGLTRHCIL